MEGRGAAGALDPPHVHILLAISASLCTQIAHGTGVEGDLPLRRHCLRQFHHHQAEFHYIAISAVAHGHGSHTFRSSASVRGPPPIIGIEFVPF